MADNDVAGQIDISHPFIDISVGMVTILLYIFIFLDPFLIFNFLFIFQYLSF